jgi:hypothetical protein
MQFTRKTCLGLRKYVAKIGWLHVGGCYGYAFPPGITSPRFPGKCPEGKRPSRSTSSDETSLIKSCTQALRRIPSTISEKGKDVSSNISRKFSRDSLSEETGQCSLLSDPAGFPVADSLKAAEENEGEHSQEQNEVDAFTAVAANIDAGSMNRDIGIDSRNPCSSSQADGSPTESQSAPPTSAQDIQFSQKIER